MSRPPDPVVAEPTSDQVGALADILVVRPDGRPAVDLGAELLHRFPGATLVVVVGVTGLVTVVFRELPTQGSGAGRAVRLENLQGPS